MGFSEWDKKIVTEMCDTAIRGIEGSMTAIFQNNLDVIFQRATEGQKSPKIKNIKVLDFFMNRACASFYY